MNLSTFDGFKRMKAKGARDLSPEEVRALQQTLLSILDDMAPVLRAQRVPWTLGGGSALGALRHGGFIPWDDDLDVNMPRQAWPRFRDAFRKRFGDRYDILEPGSPPDYPLAFPRIRLAGTNVVTREDLTMPWIGHGAFIDVFLLESVPDGAVARRLHGLGSLLIGFLYSCRKHWEERAILRECGPVDGAVRLKTAAGFFLSFAPAGAWTRLWDRWNGMCRGNANSRLATFPVGRRHYFGELAERTALAEPRPAAFEGREAFVPRDAEAYMARLYGAGWRVPPPESERERHALFGPPVLRPGDAAPRGILVVVAAHKPYRMPRDPVYLPVQTGAAGKAPIPGFARDDGGDGISGKNPSYCELTALYWAWKNLDADAVGLVHYRRHFAGPCGTVASWRDFAALLEGRDAILPAKRRYFIETTYSQYAHAHHAKDLDAARGAIAEKWPEYLDAFDRTMRSTSGHRFNMMVMRRPAFDGYCGWLFAVLAELERRIDVTGYSAYDSRVFGFIAERLLDVWVETKGISFAEMPVIHLEGQNWPAKAAAFLSRKFRRR